MICTVRNKTKWNFW